MPRLARRVGVLIPVGQADTIADGLRTSLSDLTFGVLRAHLADVATVTEDETVHAKGFRSGNA